MGPPRAPDVHETLTAAGAALWGNPGGGASADCTRRRPQPCHVAWLFGSLQYSYSV